MLELHDRAHNLLTHSFRVAHLCRVFAEYKQLGPDMADKLEVAGILHDLGLVYVDAEIINSKLELTADQWLKIEEHPRIGYELALELWGDPEIAHWILHHHCIKGPRTKGYPANDCNLLQTMPVGLQVLICAERFDRGYTNGGKDARVMAAEIEHLAARRAIGTGTAYAFRRFIELGLHKPLYCDAPAPPEHYIPILYLVEGWDFFL